MLTSCQYARDKSGHSGQLNKYVVWRVPTWLSRVQQTRDTRLERPDAPDSPAHVPIVIHFELDFVTRRTRPMSLPERPAVV
jgi:hypothetical protein